MNGNPRISEKTKQQVLEAVQEMGYTPNPAAKSLRLRSTRLVGVFVNALTPAFETTMEILTHLNDCLQEKGYTCFTCIIGIRAEKEAYYLQMMQILNACAVIKVVSYSSQDLDSICTIPIFYVYNYPMTGENGPAVYRIETDNYGAGYQAGSELIRLGCQRIAEVRLVNPSSQYPFARHIGFMQAIYDHNACYAEEASVICNENNFSAIVAGIEVMLASTSPADGYFCSSDLMALALLESLDMHGYAIPQRIKIIGCNDMSVSLHSIKQISTIRHRIADLCNATVETMLQVLSGKNIAEIARQKIFPTDLISRETTIES